MRSSRHPNVAPFFSQAADPAPGHQQPEPGLRGARGGRLQQRRQPACSGNLKAVIKAILLDDEARSASAAAAPRRQAARADAAFAGWARAFNATRPATPGPSATPPTPARGSARARCARPRCSTSSARATCRRTARIAAPALVAPEFQITNESSVVGYVNFMQRAVASGAARRRRGRLRRLLPLADDARRCSTSSTSCSPPASSAPRPLATLTTARRRRWPRGTDPARRNRIYAALMLVLAAPEFLVHEVKEHDAMT